MLRCRESKNEFQEADTMCQNQSSGDVSIDQCDEHTRLGLPVYVWRNSRVVKLSPSADCVLSTTTLHQPEVALLRAR